MNAKKAKALRSEIYGDNSQRTQRQYGVTRSGTIFNLPNTPRSIYQRTKRHG